MTDPFIKRIIVHYIFMKISVFLFTLCLKNEFTVVVFLKTFTIGTTCPIIIRFPLPDEMFLLILSECHYLVLV